MTELFSKPYAILMTLKSLYWVYMGNIPRDFQPGWEICDKPLGASHKRHSDADCLRKYNPPLFFERG